MKCSEVLQLGPLNVHIKRPQRRISVKLLEEWPPLSEGLTREIFYVMKMQMRESAWTACFVSARPFLFSISSRAVIRVRGEVSSDYSYADVLFLLWHIVYFCEKNVLENLFPLRVMAQIDNVNGLIMINHILRAAIYQNYGLSWIIMVNCNDIGAIMIYHAPWAAIYQN